MRRNSVVRLYLVWSFRNVCESRKQHQLHRQQWRCDINGDFFSVKHQHNVEIKPSGVDCEVDVVVLRHSTMCVDMCGNGDGNRYRVRTQIQNTKFM